MSVRSANHAVTDLHTQHRTLETLVADAIDVERFAGVLNVRVRFAALDRKSNRSWGQLGASATREQPA